MVDAIREKHALGINDELFEIVRVSVTGIGLQDRFERLADGQVMLVFLVIKDVAPRQARFGEVICELLLIEGELIKLRDPVAENLNIGKLVGNYSGSSKYRYLQPYIGCFSHKRINVYLVATMFGCRFQCRGHFRRLI